MAALIRREVNVGFEWKDELLLREAAVVETDGRGLFVSMERYLQERDAKDKAERFAIDFRQAAERWCDRARGYCRWRNRLLWGLALALGWAVGATWVAIR